MKIYNIMIALAFMMMLTSCRIVVGVFKAGIWAGMLVLGGIIAVAMRLNKN